MNVPMFADHVSRAASLPLEAIDPSDPALYQQDAWQPYFARLRREDPVHYVPDSPSGPYWAVTKYQDIIRLEVNHKVFSSSWQLGGIKIDDMPKGYERPSFIWRDPPEHGPQRLAVTPSVAPGNLARMESLIRERTRLVIDGLPRGEAFDWVDRVSIELTSMMLATLFDYPVEDRRQLIHWSDVAIANVDAPDSPVRSEEERFAIQMDFTRQLGELWDKRAKQPPRFDLISLMAHGETTRDMSVRDRMGMLILFLVGGNDTTRNSMSGGIWGLSRFPEEMHKLRARPDIIPGAVSDIIRWQTPVIHMRRTATEDTDFGGKAIRKGDKVVVWYISGNRDETVIDRPDALVVDRARPREHLAFGFGIHRCLGNRLAELQVRVLLEEIVARGLEIEVLDRPVYAYSNFLRTIRSLPVRIAA